MNAITWLALCMAAGGAAEAGGSELFPPAAAIQADHPRLLLRKDASPYAVSLGDLRGGIENPDSRQMLQQLRGQNDAASQAMVWLLTGEDAAAEKAIRRMLDYRYPGGVDTFHVYFRLSEFALAYDWLYGHPQFTGEVRSAVRANVAPLVEAGLKYSDDHVFHNYIWMSAGACAWWSLATVGEDEQSDRFYGVIAERFNRRLFPAMEYLDGLPSEPMGYWSLYDLTPAVMTVIALQSASQSDRVGLIAREQGDWLSRHFENLIHSVLPNMRYIPWGDLQSGPNGGVTYEMAGTIDAATWALDSPHGAWLTRWLADKRGLRRFHGSTAMYYFLYTRQLDVQPEEPSRTFLAGGSHAGHFITRSDWDDGATIVTLRATDHYGDHNHYDQGSFLIYRNGLLAVDPPVYRKIRGPQQLTEHHNTLLLNGQPQRPVRGQWFRTVESFQENLNSGRMLETGDMLFYKDQPGWSAAACQFAQAYDAGLVASCVRQLLLIRPGKIIVVDQLVAPDGSGLPEVDWLLQLPAEPSRGEGAVWAGNGQSWIRVCPLLPAVTEPDIQATPVGTHRVRFHYSGTQAATLVHLIEIGDGQRPGAPVRVDCQAADGAVVLKFADGAYRFQCQSPFEIDRDN